MYDYWFIRDILIEKYQFLENILFEFDLIFHDKIYLPVTFSLRASGHSGHLCVLQIMAAR
jgi:hypothetical protein